MYNDFGQKILANLDDFLNVFRQNEHAIGHVVFFGLPEHYCKFRESEIQWQDSKYHFLEAKVSMTNFLTGKSNCFIQLIAGQLEKIFWQENFNTFPQVFVTFITLHEAPNKNIFEQSSSSSRNPENNLNFQNYDPENCLVTGKQLFLHQDSSQTPYVLFQDSYKLMSKKESYEKRSFA